MFFNNYSKPGKGVDKRDPDQPRIQIFFDVLPRKLGDLFKLNILYLLTTIPFFIITMVIVGIISSSLVDSMISTMDNESLASIYMGFRVVSAFLFMIFFGQGPLTAGYIYIIREHSREHPCWLISDFFERSKANFKQGILLWIIDLMFIYLLTVALRFYGQSGMIVPQYFISVVAVLYGMMHIYVYHIMITFELSLKNILRNSLILAVAKAPVSLLILFLNIIIYVAIPIAVVLTVKSMVVILIMLLIEVLMLPPITNFAINFCIDSMLDKYINA